MKYFTYAQAEKESEIYVLPLKTQGVRMEFFMQVLKKKFPHEGTIKSAFFFTPTLRI